MNGIPENKAIKATLVRGTKYMMGNLLFENGKPRVVDVDQYLRLAKNAVDPVTMVDKSKKGRGRLTNRMEPKFVYELIDQEEAKQIIQAEEHKQETELNRQLLKQLLQTDSAISVAEEPKPEEVIQETVSEVLGEPELELGDFSEPVDDIPEEQKAVRKTARKTRK